MVALWDEPLIVGTDIAEYQRQFAEAFKGNSKGPLVMVANPPPGLTLRAAAALTPFLDEAMRLERQGMLIQKANCQVAVGFTVHEWTELLAAMRESMRTDEGIPGGDISAGNTTAKEISGG